MKKEKEYVEHLKESWSFANKIANEELGQKNQLATNLALSIFDKMVSPYHYFLKDVENKENNQTNQTVEKPTIKQIDYAKKLGITDPENFTKEGLSREIEKKLSEKKK